LNNDIKNAFSRVNIDLNELQVNQFSEYRRLLQEWNKVMNLTAVDDDEGILQRHFLDSCQLLLACEIKPDMKIIDVGTGAGFPGLPIAIVTGCHATLLDALNKRIHFLETVCENAKINHIECIHGRAEDIGKNIEYREQYDYAVARAVANLTVLMEYTIPFVKVGGALIAHKATQSDAEIDNAKEAMKLLGCELEKKIVLSTEDNVDRTLIIIRKISETPQKYPRKSGIPLKRPLK
jgi:16S rRNA (guanine527-N7)-methyltransferase